MGTFRVKVPHLVRKPSGYYWQPTLSVKALGFVAESLGKNLANAMARAHELNKRVAAHRAEPASVQTENVKALIGQYRRTEKYRKLEASSRYNFDLALDRIEQVGGRYAVATITRRDMVQVKDKLTAEHGIKRANRFMKVWSALLQLAWDLSWRQDNPARGLSGADHTDRDRVWSPQEVGNFCAAATASGRPSMALAVLLALDIGQRAIDVRRLTWADFDGVGFVIRQTKTKQVVRVPVSPAMAWLLSQRTDQGPVVMNERTGKAYGAVTFGHLFKELRTRAGLPDDLQFRDLRRTAATELGAAGATDDEIRAVTGHRNRNVVAVYVRPDGRMAAAGQAKRRKLESVADFAGNNAGNRRPNAPDQID